jgi:hypothetical protein
MVPFDLYVCMYTYVCMYADVCVLCRSMVTFTLCVHVCMWSCMHACVTYVRTLCYISKTIFYTHTHTNIRTRGSNLKGGPRILHTYIQILYIYIYTCTRDVKIQRAVDAFFIHTHTWTHTRTHTRAVKIKRQ